ncbi:metallophosphatase domain-containing protein [Candidatus Uabimicrobium sp. HlEnr_7]|uniref:metallophosphatase domain-containing protein n=1 Tax=Candidatus Uabimicrobium helgolandensis TaxID=3095367 RepID=UPI0035583365
MSKIKIVAISDTHNRRPQVTIPDGDILIHAGDITSKGALRDVRRFNNYLGELPHKHKIVIAGNHDFCFEREREAAQKELSNAIYLQDSEIVIEGIKFYGSPWQPWFFDWAFNLQRGEEIREKWQLIPNDTNVLITHGPPLGYGDTVANGNKVGCEDLLNKVIEIKPRYHIFGHIHEAYGITKNDHTTFVNASICTLEYKPTNQPTQIEYILS